jgi:hypothetical protein
MAEIELAPPESGYTKGGSITVLLTSCLTVLQIKTKNVSCLTANSKPVKQEVSSTVICIPCPSVRDEEEKFCNNCRKEVVKCSECSATLRKANERLDQMW